MVEDDGDSEMGDDSEILCHIKKEEEDDDDEDDNVEIEIDDKVQFDSATVAARKAKFFDDECSSNPQHTDDSNDASCKSENTARLPILKSMLSPVEMTEEKIGKFSLFFLDPNCLLHSLLLIASSQFAKAAK